MSMEALPDINVTIKVKPDMLDGSGQVDPAAVQQILDTLIDIINDEATQQKVLMAILDEVQQRVLDNAYNWYRGPPWTGPDVQVDERAKDRAALTKRLYEVAGHDPEEVGLTTGQDIVFDSIRDAVQRGSRNNRVLRIMGALTAFLERGGMRSEAYTIFGREVAHLGQKYKQHQEMVLAEFGDPSPEAIVPPRPFMRLAVASMRNDPVIREKVLEVWQAEIVNRQLSQKVTII